jgi:hypothetical protein
VAPSVSATPPTAQPGRAAGTATPTPPASPPSTGPHPPGRPDAPTPCHHRLDDPSRTRPRPSARPARCGGPPPGVQEQAVRHHHIRRRRCRYLHPGVVYGRMSVAAGECGSTTTATAVRAARSTHPCPRPSSPQYRPPGPARTAPGTGRRPRPARTAVRRGVIHRAAIPAALSPYQRLEPTSEPGTRRRRPNHTVNDHRGPPRFFWDGRSGRTRPDLAIPPLAISAVSTTAPTTARSAHTGLAAGRGPGTTSDRSRRLRPGPGPQPPSFASKCCRTCTQRAESGDPTEGRHWSRKPRDPPPSPCPCTATA